MTLCEALHPCPRPAWATSLTAAANYFEPQTRYLVYKTTDAVTVARLAAHGESLAVLARVDGIAALDGPAPKGSAQLVVGEATYVLPLEGVIDVDREAARLARQVEKLDGEIAKIETKLGNEKFTSRAPAQVIEQQRERRRATLETRDKVTAALARLAAL